MALILALDVNQREMLIYTIKRIGNGQMIYLDDEREE